MARHPVARALGGWRGFGLGLGASLLVEALAPDLAKRAAPAARSALKFLFRVGDQLTRSTAQTREQITDFVAETRSEYDAEQVAGPRANGDQPAERRG